MRTKPMNRQYWQANFHKWIGNKTDIRRCDVCGKWMKAASGRLTCSKKCAEARAQARRAIDESVGLSEKRAFRAMPYAGDLSEDMRAWVRQHKDSAPERESVMCQNCGSVLIIGTGRIEHFRKSGVAYCDRECAGEDRPRVYRNSTEVWDKWRATQGIEERPVATRVRFGVCRQCGKAYVNRTRSKCCSIECSAAYQKAKAKLSAFIESRAGQKPKETNCAHCGVTFTALVRGDAGQHYCTRACWKKHARKHAKHTRRERMKLPAGAKRGRVSLSQVFDRFGGECAICGVITSMSSQWMENQATVDHIHPLSRGGLHVEANTQLACWRCNTNKSDRIDAEDVAASSSLNPSPVG
jgi:hypothetical protein